MRSQPELAADFCSKPWGKQQIMAIYPSNKSSKDGIPDSHRVLTDVKEAQLL